MNEIPAELKTEKYTVAARLSDFIKCQLSHWKSRQEFEALRTSAEEYSLKGFDDLQCIFVHIPKSAGVSINRELFGNLGGAHRSVRTYKRVFGPVVFSKYYKFTFVRNPYSRLLSAYRFLKKGGFCEKDRLWAEQNLAGFSTFSDFVHDWLTEETILEYNHFIPQFMFVCDRSFEPEVDFIGHFETIEDDFAAICSKLGVKRKLKKLNQGPQKETPWHDFYTEEAFEKVYQIYRKDFELFGYSARPE